MMSRCSLSLVLMTFTIAAWLQTTIAARQLESDDTPVIYLHTEFLPWANTEVRARKCRLTREIGRQSFLIAVRDELGLATRDGTLKEIAPMDTNVVHLALLVRTSFQGETELRLYQFDPEDLQHETHGLWEKKPDWTQAYKHKADRVSLYQGLSTVLGSVTKSDFVGALKTVGVEGGDVPKTKPPATPEHWLDLAEEVDFVAQFGLVREVHEFVNRHGETPELLGLLVRAYAHMSILTEHHWNASSDVFAARSIVYANRLVETNAKVDLALWHRAYAWALTGCHQHALADMEKIRERRKSTSEQGLAVSPNDPSWTELVETYCLCDRNKMKKLADSNPAIHDWGLRLWFQLTYMSRYPVWINRDAQTVARKVPTAYAAYARLAQFGDYLGPTRLGARLGPLMFGSQLHESLAELKNLPETIDDLVDAGEEVIELRAAFDDPNPNDEFSPLPTFTAKKFRKASQTDQSHGISWSALAYLIDEEVFVQAGNSMVVALNATESSLDDEVDAVWPFVKNHPYAGIIKAFRYHRRFEFAEHVKAVEPIKFEDPDATMLKLARRLKGIENQQGADLFSQYWRASVCNSTLQGTIDYWFTPGKGPAAGRGTESKTLRSAGKLLRNMGPHSEVGLRMVLLGTLREKKLRTIAKQVKSDPKCFEILGDRYQEFGAEKKAIACYEESLELLPSSSATKKLAEIYYQKEQYGAWERTYLDFFETEDLGLAHQSAKLKLCNGFIQRGLFREAKPYAIECARNWSQGGLMKASLVTELLGQWEESEKWIREATKNYPTNSGLLWYCWCCRTGRGDRETARSIAEKYSQGLSDQTRSECIAQGVFYLHEGEKQKSLTFYRKALTFKPTLSCTWMVAMLSRELNDEPSRVKVIADLKRYQLEATNPSAIEEFQIAAIELLETGKASDELLMRLKTEYLKFTEIDKSVFGYLLGAELNRIGKTKLANKYFLRSMIHRGNETHSLLATAEFMKKTETLRAKLDEELTPDSKLHQPIKEDEVAEPATLNDQKD